MPGSPVVVSNSAVPVSAMSAVLKPFAARSGATSTLPAPLTAVTAIAIDEDASREGPRLSDGDRRRREFTQGARAGVVERLVGRRTAPVRRDRSFICARALHDRRVLALKAAEVPDVDGRPVDAAV